MVRYGDLHKFSRDLKTIGATEGKFSVGFSSLSKCPAINVRSTAKPDGTAQSKAHCTIKSGKSSSSYCPSIMAGIEEKGTGMIEIKNFHCHWLPNLVLGAKLDSLRGLNSLQEKNTSEPNSPPHSCNCNITADYEQHGVHVAAAAQPLDASATASVAIQHYIPAIKAKIYGGAEMKIEPKVKSFTPSNLSVGVFYDKNDFFQSAKTPSQSWAIGVRTLSDPNFILSKVAFSGYMRTISASGGKSEYLVEAIQPILKDSESSESSTSITWGGRWNLDAAGTTVVCASASNTLESLSLSITQRVSEYLTATIGTKLPIAGPTPSEGIQYGLNINVSA